MKTNNLYIKILFLLFLAIFYTGCKNNFLKDQKQQVVNTPKITYLQDAYNTKVYLFERAKYDELAIKYMFNFAKHQTGHIEILSNKEIFQIEDRVIMTIDSTKNRFTFKKKNTYENQYVLIKVYYLKLVYIDFLVEEIQNKIKLSTDFEELNLNVLQNFLDYVKEDETKKSNEVYTYELYNKDNVKKVVLTYHNHGEWFSVDIL